MTEIIILLLFAAPCAGGTAASLLMFWFFRVVFRKLSTKDQLRNFAKVLGWFVGNNAIILPILFAVDFNKAVNAPWGKALLILSYVLGFSVTTSIQALRREPTIVQELSSYLPPEQVEVVVDVLLSGTDSSKISPEMYLQALRTLNRMRKE